MDTKTKTWSMSKLVYISFLTACASGGLSPYTKFTQLHAGSHELHKSGKYLTDLASFVTRHILCFGSSHSVS